MGLSLQPTRRLGGKIATLIAVFALVVQPMYGLVAEYVANALDVTTVTSTNLQGWRKLGSHMPSFVKDTSAPGGAGALELSTPNANSQLHRSISSERPLARDFVGSYTTKKLAGTSEYAAPAYVIGIDLDGNPTTPDNFYAWYEPTYNGHRDKVFTQWNTWELTPESKFWFNGVRPQGLGSNYTYTLAEAISGYEDKARLFSYTINQGSGNDGYITRVSDFVTHNAKYSFEYTHSPSIAHSNFNTHSGTDYKGINVGFTLNDDFEAVSKISVSLLKDGEPFVTNVSNQRLIDDYNNGDRQFSTPFIMKNGTYRETHWDLGNYVWRAGDKPTGYRVTVEASNGQVFNFDQALSEDTADFDELVPITPVITGITSERGGFIRGKTQKIYLTIANPETMAGGWLQLNKATEGSAPANADRTNYRLQQEPGDNGRWYAEIDTTNIVKRAGTNLAPQGGHQGDGKYLYKVEAHYAGAYNPAESWGYYGNMSWTSPEHHFVVDNTGPSITSKNPANGQIIRGNHTVSAVVTDTNGVNPDSVYARFTNSEGREFTYYLQREGESNVYSREVDTTQFVPQGESLTLNRVSFRAVDSVGNPRSSISSNVTIDNQKPTIEITSPTGDDVFNPLQATLTATDTVGLARLDVTYWNADNTEPIRNSAGDVRGWGAVVPTEHKTDWTTSFNLPTDLEDGTYTIRATATDLAGNSMNATNATFTVDSEAPVVEFLNLGNGLTYSPTYRGAVDIDARIFDLNLSHYYLSIWLNGDRYSVPGAWNTRTTPGPGFESRILATLTADGNYRVLLEARDKAGNKDENSVKEITFTIDNSPELNARYFVAHESHMGVGFSVDYLSDDATSVTVELLDGETVVATNIGDTDAMRDLLNKNPEEISSPFFLVEGDWSDEYWRLASPVDWATVNRPTMARVTLNYGDGNEPKIDTVYLSESELGHSFEALRAQFIQDRADRLAAEEAERVAEEARRAQERQDELDRIAREQAERERLAREAAAAQAERDRLEAEAAAAGRGALPITPLATVFPAGDTVIDDATSEDEDDEAEESGEVAAATTGNSENGDVLAAEDTRDQWSLVNLLLTIAVAAASLFALVGLAGKREGDKNVVARVLSIVPALGAGAVLYFVEDFGGSMSWVNIWTLLVGGLVLVQMIILASTRSQAE